MSPQEQLDEERGLTPERCIRFALFTAFDKPPEWKITKAAEAIHLTLRKMGFKIVPMERGDYE